MGTTSRYLAATRLLAVCVSIAFAACKDKDHTQICLGPDCPNPFYPEGGAGGEGSGGTAGEAGTGGDSPDLDGGMPDSGLGPDPIPDATVPDSGSAEPCAVAFLVPTGGDAEQITLGASDDVDGTACGDEFTAAVSIASNASTINLFVNDNPLGAQSVSSPITDLDVVLGNRGDTTPNTLRVVAQMPNGDTCEATFGADIFVDCDGPSCSITSPVPAEDNSDFLNASQDEAPLVADFQTDVLVTSEAEHAGESVRLQVDADFVPDQVLAQDGTVAFADLTLTEDLHSVLAECRDALGNVTRSPLTVWNVDITACSLSIDEIAGNADPVTPANDIDQNPGNGIQVLVTGQITGSDCKTLNVGACGQTPTSIDISSQPADPTFFVTITLANATASLSVCADVVDDAGNPSEQITADVEVRIDPPVLQIASPAGPTQFNRSGGPGAVVDANLATPACDTSVSVNCTDANEDVVLFVDGSSAGTANCAPQSGLPSPFLGVATFSGVSLTTKNDGEVTILSATQTLPGLPVGTAPDVTVQADCEAPACAISSPSSSLDYLTVDADGSTVGFQSSFTVQSDVNSAGESARITFDADDDTTLTTTFDAGGQATFVNVTLSQDLHSAEAECFDAAGNVSVSAPEAWTVDSIACTSSLIVAGGVDPITTNHDLNVPLADLQVLATGSVNELDCVDARVGVCGFLTGLPTVLSSGSFGLGLTLPSVTGPTSACVEITDLAGNVGTTTALLDVRVDPPVLVITSPEDADTFNSDSPSDCTTDVVVTCTDDGEDVDLLVDGAIVDTEVCTSGEVTFSLALPEHDDVTTTTLTAEQTADGLLGTSDPITVQADCNVPEPTFDDLTCPSQLALAGDDVAPLVAGLQYDVLVLNDGGAEVTLTITRSTVPAVTTNTGDLTSTSFLAASLGAPGAISLDACAEDIHGNVGCTATCAITIAAEPTIAITSPTTGATFTSATTDCAPLVAGLQATVSGTTTAADGSTVDVTLGTADPGTSTASGGTWSVCVPTLEGNNQQLVAHVTDLGNGLEDTDTITISVDSTPSGVIAPPGFEVTARREGEGDLTWLSVLDSDDAPLDSYHVRCATTDITDETTWNAATDIPVAISPSGVVGTEETLPLTGIRTGTSRFCVVRGEDNDGNLSPITGPVSGVVANPFEQQLYAVADAPNNATGVVRVSVEPLGDINGDGIADFAHGATQNGARIFFGKTSIGTNPTETADLTLSFTSVPPTGYGSEVAGLGDISGDGRPDFALGAPNSNAVFVFFGRAAGNDWPLSINVDAVAPCEADLCITGPAGGLFGWDIHSANLDNAGPNDLVIAARTSNTRGQVFVVLGGTQLATSGTTIALQNTSPETNPVIGFLVNGPATDRPNFGFSVGSIGTNLSSLLITANGFPIAGSNLGAVYVLPTQATPAVGTGLTVLTTPVLQEIESGPATNFGAAIRAVGDYDDDGFVDFAAGKSFNTGGIVTLYRGSALGTFSSTSVLQFTNDLVLPPVPPLLDPSVLDDNYGSFIAAGLRADLGLVGDLDNDEIAELLIGASIPDTADTRGSAQLFYGALGAVARGRTVADFTHTATVTLGEVVPNFVGDINDDGFNDIALLDAAIGSPNPTDVLFLLY